MQKQRLFSFLLAAVIIFAAPIFGNVAADELESVTLEEAEKLQAEGLEEGGMSEALEAFIKRPKAMGRTAKGDEKPLGLIPSVKEFNTNYSELNKFGAMRASLPRKYDLRKTGRLTPIRDQGPNGSCWAFACYGALESYLRPRAYYDFSEKHMRNTHGFDFKATDGGNREMSTAYMARWSGPVAESDDPYDPYDFYSKENYTRRQDLIHALFLPGRRNKNDNDIIKSAIMEYGGVSTIINGNEAYLNKRTAGFYDYSNSGANHAVVIVGWDDDYSRRNFNKMAPGDGAFIVRNSWGANWGDKGYYYISYYDNNIGAQNTVYISENTGKRDGIYQYDPLGVSDDVGFGQDSAWMANVFGPVRGNQKIVSVGFYATSTGAEYDVYINTNVTNSNPFGNKVKVASGRFTHAGYHVVDIDPVVVKSGNRFAPIVHVRTPGYNRPIPVERPFRGYTSRATANSGESFISRDGRNFSDLTNNYRNTNVCLKAFTGKGGSTPNPAPTPDPEPTPDPQPEEKQLNLTVKARKAVYLPGEEFHFDIKVQDEDGYNVKEAELAVVLTTPNNESYDATLRTNYRGEAVYKAKLHQHATEGKYSIKVNASKTGYGEAKADAYITCQKKKDDAYGTMQVELTANKKQYKPGDNANFTAKVTNMDGKTLQYATVKFSIKLDGKEYESTKKTNRYGKAYFSYYIPRDTKTSEGNLVAEASGYKWNGGSASLSIKVVSPSDPEPNKPDPEPEEKAITVVVKPERTTYALGYAAYINIYAMVDGKPVSNAKVKGTIVLPNGKEVPFEKTTTNYYGRTAIKMSTSYNSPAGTYTVKAVISKDGLKDGSGEAKLRFVKYRY